MKSVHPIFSPRLDRQLPNLFPAVARVHVAFVVDDYLAVDVKHSEEKESRQMADFRMGLFKGGDINNLWKELFSSTIIYCDFQLLSLLTSVFLDVATLQLL